MKPVPGGRIAGLHPYDRILCPVGKGGGARSARYNRTAGGSGHPGRSPDGDTSRRTRSCWNISEECWCWDRFRRRALNTLFTLRALETSRASGASGASGGQRGL